MLVKLKGSKVQLYDSIENLPILRYRDFNKFLLIDSGIGSDLESVTERLQALERFINSKQLDKLSKEFSNLRQSLFFIVGNVSPKYSCFACLVKSIDGKEYPEELSNDDLDEIVNKLSDRGTTIGQLKNWLKAIKKNFDKEFELFFPKMTKDVTLVEYYTKLKKIALLALRSLLEKEDVAADIDKLEKSILDSHDPQIFAGSDGVEATHIKGFNATALYLSQQFNKDPENLTTLKYYQLIEIVKQQVK